MNAMSLLAVTRLLASREIASLVTVVFIHKRKCQSAGKGLFCFKVCLGQEVKGILFCFGFWFFCVLFFFKLSA